MAQHLSKYFKPSPGPAQVRFVRLTGRLTPGNCSKSMRRIDDLHLNTSLLRVLVLAAAVIALSADIYEELADTQSAFQVHHIFEFAAILGITWLFWLEIEVNVELRSALKREREHVDRLSGELSRHVERCFRSWQLTQAEQDVAWLLLKGFSFAEIASLRDVKEKTLRQQASSIYGKADVSGRSELSATFLEDVLAINVSEKSLPPEPPAAAQSQ
jgi:DNA-binding CsgD family transcriptional regulator